MKTTILAAMLLAAAAGTAEASGNYRNVDALVAPGPRGGQILVALDLECRGGGNFVMQTDRNDYGTYRGCAYRESGRLVIRWNDGAVVNYGFDEFTRTTASFTVS